MNTQGNGKTVEVPERQIEIYNIQLLKYTTDTITYQTNCSKGTYIRTLCEDIAQELGTVGYMQTLTRTSFNNFKLEESVSIEKLNNTTPIIPIEEIFKNKPNILLDNRELKLFLNGVQLTFSKNNKTYKIYYENQFIRLRIN